MSNLQLKQVDVKQEKITTKPIRYEDGGDILFATPIKKATKAEVNWNSGPQASGWQARGNGPQAVEMSWGVLLDEIEHKPHLGWPWDNGDQTDEEQGSTDDDPEPTETEEGGDDDGRSNDDLGESAFLTVTLDKLRSGQLGPLYTCQTQEEMYADLI